MSRGIADRRITVRFTDEEVERIDAALDRAQDAHAYGYRPDRSGLIHAAVMALLTGDAPGRRWPPERRTPSSASDVAGPTTSDAARAPSDRPGTSDASGAVGRKRRRR